MILIPCFTKNVFLIFPAEIGVHLTHPFILHTVKYGNCSWSPLVYVNVVFFVFCVYICVYTYVNSCIHTLIFSRVLVGILEMTFVLSVPFTSTLCKSILCVCVCTNIHICALMYTSTHIFLKELSGFDECKNAFPPIHRCVLS